MESEQTGLALSLPLSPEYVNSPVEFAHEYLFPSPEALNTGYFGLDNVLFAVASDSEDFEPVGMAHPEPQVLTSGLPAEVQETIASARAPSIRKLYSSKWKV